ncbi:MAG TPA: thioredoxin domain-containing protein, partial [Phycisphaerae bacterium]
GLPLIGLALAALLAASQIGLTSPAIYRAGESQNTLPPLDPYAVPLVGSPDAPYLITLLFDYKCPHCQKLHAMLDETIRRYHGKLAFALCPAPLNTQCNPYVPQDLDEFKDSCELAKVSLAVWLAKRDAFPAFDQWMFSPESPDPSAPWQPRSLDAAIAKAVQSVGQTKFDAARADPWINRFMQTSIQTYGNSIRLGQSSNAVPKLVLGTRWVIPEPNTPNDLITILHNSLALPNPEP